MASFQQSLIDALQLDNFPKLKSFVESTEMAPTEDVVGAADMPMPKTIDNETIQNNLNAFLSRKGSKKRLAVDGIIGTDTTSVIKDFQKAQGLEADGIVGSKTIAALYSMPSIGSNAVEVKTLEPAQVSDAPIEPPVSKGIMTKQEPTKEVAPVVMPEELSVEQIQGYLTIEGFDVGGVDGKMGPKTRRAIREFQKSKGLKADGIVGKNTISALLSEPKEDPLADKRPKVRPNDSVADTSDTTAKSSYKGLMINPMMLAKKASKLIPSHMRMFAKDLTGLDLEETKTEDFFNEAEKVSMLSVIKNSMDRLGDKSTGSVTYEDYASGLADVTWNKSNVDPLSIRDAEGSVKKTLGQFTWKVDDNGDIIVTDEYDFNDAKELQEQYPSNKDKVKHLTSLAAQVATGDLSKYGWLRKLGGLYGSQEGEGVSFEVNLGDALQLDPRASKRPKVRGSVKEEPIITRRTGRTT